MSKMFCNDNVYAEPTKGEVRIRRAISRVMSKEHRERPTVQCVDGELYVVFLEERAITFKIRYTAVHLTSGFVHVWERGLETEPAESRTPYVAVLADSVYSARYSHLNHKHRKMFAAWLLKQNDAPTEVRLKALKILSYTIKHSD